MTSGSLDRDPGFAAVRISAVLSFARPAVEIVVDAALAVLGHVQVVDLRDARLTTAGADESRRYGRRHGLSRLILGRGGDGSEPTEASRRDHAYGRPHANSSCSKKTIGAAE